MRFFGPVLVSVLVGAPDAAIDADTVGAADAALDEWVDAPLDDDGVAAYVAQPANDGFRAHPGSVRGGFIVEYRLDLPLHVFSTRFNAQYRSTDQPC